MSYKEIVVISGKGGTGKTTIVGSLASLFQEIVLTDCDVDAADLHLLLHPEIKEKNDFYGGEKASIDRNKCRECGLCEEMCRFGAIDNFQIDSIFCEGCRFCYHLCPEESISMIEEFSGHWYVSQTKYGPFVHAKLGIAAENSGKLVSRVRARAREIVRETNVKYIITDGPPGIGCPVIASMTGADLVLIVTEPTISGFHDLERVVDTARHFNVIPLVCINKYDLHPGKAQEIEDYCKDKGIKLGGKVSFDRDVIGSIVKGMPLVEYSDGKASGEIKKLWQEILKCL
ncbi:ATP-binding protein [Candidatus Contubernalis alkaliaceticus]|uniref:ATP-binding protein n=1 Tax=Candidatus Contubernalis alkaliaceticus TaxID=338645 RepID=UPI001F4C1DDD|nr:ATP-binding protein [Candidatus Contubernalis alkalaceticus]UNC93285.1 4Fe-4S binding protein [Candidatus Contubernalis alkalaceticus]